jgi:uncharacterized RDD family membrane protein YckC
MKCPKCGYLGFETVERCRNCGYDFSLASSPRIPDFLLRSDTQTISPLDDLSLVDAATATPRPSMSDVGANIDAVLGQPGIGVAAVVLPASPPRADLPLFGPPIPDDEPLITKPSPPRPPLAVRRATPDGARQRAERARKPSLDLALDLEDATQAMLRPTAHPARAGTQTRNALDAGVGARLVAVVLDLLVLAAVDAVVIYFTIQICGITVDDLGILPKGPLVAFLFVQNGGYLVAFTAGGQTLGKMAAGIRVVPAGSAASVDLGRAFLRTLMWLLLAVPAGLGFLTALFSRDHRGLHDRFAGTRVVRASA